MLRFDTSVANTSELLSWPPLRVYTSDSGVQWRPVGDLVYLKAEANYTWLHWVDGQRLLIPYTLKRVGAKLPPAWFSRLHRHYLVNGRFIDRVELSPTGALAHLTIGIALPISRRRWPFLRRQWSFQTYSFESAANRANTRPV